MPLCLSGTPLEKVLDAGPLNGSSQVGAQESRPRAAKAPPPSHTVLNALRQNPQPASGWKGKGFKLHMKSAS